MNFRRKFTNNIVTNFGLIPSERYAPCPPSCFWRLLAKRDSAKHTPRFPVVASTRNWFHKALKIFLFVLCSCGFLYQSFSFLKLYRAYPTLVDIHVERPNIIPLPSISLCNKNRIRRRGFCTSVPSDCKWFQRTVYCLRYTQNCLEGQTDEDIVLAAPVPALHANMNRSQGYVRLFGQRPTDLIQDCTVKAGATTPCKNYVSFVAPDNDGYPNNCIAIQSLWGKPDTELQNVPVTSRKSRIIERLPHPYKTNCTDYLMLWKQNGGHGPLTEKGCQEQCKMKLMLEKIGCVAQSLSYPHTLKICEDKNEHPSVDINEKCMEECSEACR
ncbi:uncharacterized protein TNIN_209851 [Trichonephila inaurata madagascariensis]|uniref:Uncharacterized protein n=1 Tax=Trichonephila inaurata madagascariensis TaxID=2747483 RepID=A0A8X6XBT3_9ARAC|nr:uncharacterized protein TNIN_209851 [Trichonephila inaurata madagascariensis]